YFQASCAIFQSDKELESVIGETNAKGEWLPLTEKENQVADALRLDPDEVDKRDTDYNDYLVFEGHRYRVSAKDEAAFKELQNKNEERRRQGRRRRFGEDENASDLDEDNKKLSDLAISEKRKKAALAKRDAMWKANGENLHVTKMHVTSGTLEPIIKKRPLLVTPRASFAQASTSSSSAKPERPSNSRTGSNIRPKVIDFIDLTVPRQADLPRQITTPRTTRVILPEVDPPVIVLDE
ncbi:unnamed protein product, partial [Cylicostephanus goldi]